MKKLLLILLCLPLITLAQQTYVPDDNFEQELINLGYDIAPLDNYVYTSMINTVTYLNVGGKGIADLTGISGFTALEELVCSYNQLTSLDVSQNPALNNLYCSFNQLTILNMSQNTALWYFRCYNNQLSSLDVSNNTALENLQCQDNNLTTLDVSNNTALELLYCYANPLTSLDITQNTALRDLRCGSNQLTTLDVSNNTALIWLRCYNNQLTSLDVSNNTALAFLECENNQLTSLNLKNTNNTNFINIKAITNQNLFCVQVDDAGYSFVNWSNFNPNGLGNGFNFDAQVYFSTNCSGTAIEELTTNKELLRTIDVLGRETKNKPLFYIYDDGTVEKRITIE